MAAGQLHRAAEALASSRMSSSFYGGFSGIGWAMSHVRGKLFDPDGSYSTDVLDEALKRFLNRRGWKADYDLVSGLVGFGVNALERLPSPAAISCLEGVIDRLEETAERRPEGIAWHTAPELLPPQQREQCPGGYYNLGLAHGLPGVIALLGAACAAGVRRRKARRLLDGAVAWLLAQKRKARSGSCFSSWVVPGTPRESCRLAWCYGDLGVAAALFCAARSVGQAEWERQALEIARRAAKQPPEQAGIVDAGLCHGAAGLGHVLNRLYQATGDPTLRSAARFWLERTLAMRDPKHGIAGFPSMTMDDDGKRYLADESGILTGASGVALALLAGTTSIEPEWDRMLLISVPIREEARCERAVNDCKTKGVKR